ncbi:hypothetical protein PtA15_13A349 [Puccinia triticina]|uniref:Uncharacterized protein n=1 Tax=Puccinia triticina TaxID=208348 RepID=A0ABY7D041_9BASI|nr:uncharacterized protein PtA15_13A349 [Puccinia triticina]WAQ90949.1 hypothetical protein PtA15_13A349 [Puccinia triticina]
MCKQVRQQKLSELTAIRDAESASMPSAWLGYAVGSFDPPGSESPTPRREAVDVASNDSPIDKDVALA